MNKELLGFDIRLCPEDYIDKTWNQERYDRFLLSPKVKWPLSVDQSVWPSLFRYHDIFSHGNLYSWVEGAFEIPAEDIRQQAIDMWPNLESMVECFLKYGNVHGKNGIAIAVELVEEIPKSSSQFWHAVLEPSLTARIPEDWIFLGYDVADENRHSGLSGCAYTLDEKSMLQDMWAERLNEYGLLKMLEDAMQFKKLSHQRVPEHAPFFIYSLFRDAVVLTPTK